LALIPPAKYPIKVVSYHINKPSPARFILFCSIIGFSGNLKRAAQIMQIAEENTNLIVTSHC